MTDDMEIITPTSPRLESDDSDELIAESDIVSVHIPQKLEYVEIISAASAYIYFYDQKDNS